MALARAWLQGAARQQVEQACELAARQVPLPHCVVFLDRSPDHQDCAAPAATSAGDTASSGDTASPDNPRCAVDAGIGSSGRHSRGQGPVVHVPGGDPQLALTELTAAIDAMR